MIKGSKRTSGRSSNTKGEDNIIGVRLRTKGWKKQLKSVQKQSKANAYVKAGSMKITKSGDYFMYRNLTKTQRQKSSSSSSGGGSSRSTGGGSF